MRDICDYVIPHITGNKWYNLGLQLLNDKDEPFLSSLKADQRKNTEEMCTEMFRHWLTTEKKPTWDKVIQALRAKSVNYLSIASDVEKMLDNRVRPSKYKLYVVKLHVKIIL